MTSLTFAAQGLILYLSVDICFSSAEGALEDLTKAIIDL
jgi:hypothetical protein